MSQKNDGKFYVFQKKEEPKPKAGKLILFSAITLVWIAGVVCMFMRKTDLGIIFWGASFLSAFIVYLMQRNKTTLDELREAEMMADAKPTNEGEAEKGEEKKDAQAEN